MLEGNTQKKAFNELPPLPEGFVLEEAQIPLEQRTEIPTQDNPLGIDSTIGKKTHVFTGEQSTAGKFADFVNQFGSDVVDTGNTALRGVYRGAANLVGAPVDLIGNPIAVKLGLEDPNAVPIGGSQWLKENLDKIPIGPGVTIGDLAPQNTQQQIAGRIGEEVGTTLIPAGAMIRGSNAMSKAASPIVRDVGKAAQNPTRFIRDDVASASASGLGASIAQQVDPGDQMSEFTGQMAGAFTPAGIAEMSRRAIMGGSATRQQARQNIADFEQAGATPTLAEATQKPYLASTESVFEKLPFANKVIAKKYDDTQEAIGRKVDELAKKLSQEPSKESAGRAIERGLTGLGGFTDRIKSRANVLFNKIDDYIPPESPVTVSNTQNLITDITRPIRGAENLSETALLSNPTLKSVAQAMSQDAANGQLPYQALKRLRSEIGSKIANATIFDDVAKGDLKRLYGALSEDMKEAAVKAGPQAEQAYNRASNFYKASLKRIDDDLKPIMGKLERKGYTPEDVFKTAVRGSNEGSFRLIQLKKSLKADEWSEVASGLLQRMGRAVNSKQDDTGEVFSTETFLTNWNKLNDNAKKALFTGTKYQALKNDLDKVASAASKIRSRQQTLNNPSGTAAAVINSLMFPGTLIAGAISPSVGMYAGAGLWGANKAAKILTSPKSVKWLAGATEIPIQRLPSYLARLANTMSEDDPEYNEAVKSLIEVIGSQDPTQQSQQEQALEDQGQLQ